MLRFPIEWKIPEESTRDKINRRILRLELSNEWAIVIVLRERSSVLESLNSAEIHRRNTTGEYLISGELIITTPFVRFDLHKFSQRIKAGSSFTEIISNFGSRPFNVVVSLVGHVNISDLSEKRFTNSTNEEFKQIIQMKSLEELSKDFERILNPESSCFTDVTLICGGVSIPAHKIILSARSPVFAAMFANRMKESHKNEVDITDIDETVLKALLTYIYTGKTSDLTVSSAADLLFAADKYQLQDLKTVCIYFLKASVSLQTAWKILVLGDMHSEDLKSFAVDYICNNSVEFSVIKNSQEFKALRKERPDLALDLLESMVQCRDEKLKQ